MTQMLKPLALVALLAAAQPALAQEAAEAPADPGLAMGQEEEADAVGTAYIRATHGDWEMRCVHAPEGQKDPCQLYQLLTDSEGNPVAEFSLFALPPSPEPAVAGATIVTPLETLLTQQIRLKVDEGKVKRYPFSWCSAAGCYARVGFTAEDIDAFKRGNVATVSIVPVAAADQLVDLSLSLSGFTAGFTALAADQAAQ